MDICTYTNKIRIKTVFVYENKNSNNGHEFFGLEQTYS